MLRRAGASSRATSGVFGHNLWKPGFERAGARTLGSNCNFAMKRICNLGKSPLIPEP